MMTALKNKYISVAYENGGSFGGNQRFCESKLLRDYGCGVIAAADLILYLCKYHTGFAAKKFGELCFCEDLTKEKYNELIKKLSRCYFPLIPKFGMNGLGLMSGMQAFFQLYSLPFSCHWCISDKGIWDKISQMLAYDIPVIMSVGPNFPRIWKNSRLQLYSKSLSGEYKASSSVKAHFITVTGIDEQWLEISSWGQRFYINRRMYEEYVSKYSAAFVSNILYVKRK